MLKMLILFEIFPANLISTQITTKFRPQTISFHSILFLSWILISSLALFGNCYGSNNKSDLNSFADTISATSTETIKSNHQIINPDIDTGNDEKLHRNQAEISKVVPKEENVIIKHAKNAKRTYPSPAIVFLSTLLFGFSFVSITLLILCTIMNKYPQPGLQTEQPCLDQADDHLEQWHKVSRFIGKGIDYQQQSISCKNDATVRISKLLEHKQQLISFQYETVLTMNDIFERGRQQSKNGKCLGQVFPETETIEWISYDDVLRRIKRLADGLLALMAGKNEEESSTKESVHQNQRDNTKDMRLGIYSKNCPEYTLIEYACYRHSMIVIPIYDTLGPNVASFIANQTEMTTIACDHPDKIRLILDRSESFKTLYNLILLKTDLANDELREKVAEKGWKLFTLNEIEQLGARNPVEDNQKPTPEDLAVICYTSGTTSSPKGVMLTHENLIAGITSISVHLMDQHATVDDIMISILPLAHIFQRIAEGSVFTEGGKVCYYSGDIRQLANEIKIIRPTIMLAVPRLLNRIHDAIYAKAQGNLLKRIILQLAYRQKRKHIHNHMIRNNTIWDRLVFDKVRQSMGSRIRLICVGSASLSPDVLDFLRVAIGCVISEGYGQTECSGACSASLMGDATAGHVGAPLVGSMIRLADVPEMNYFSKDGRGEIYVKGPTVFRGYYQMPELTTETLDKDGWLHTGDIGYWSPNGTLQLIDRKKNIFKLAQGEYIAVEKIENTLMHSPLLQQLFVYGDGYKSMLIAIIVPDLDYIQSHYNKSTPRYSRLNEWTERQLNKDEQLKLLILDDLKRLGRKADLKSFELPKNCYLKKQPFTIEEDFLTPTLKMKRKLISEHFKKEIQTLYQELEKTKPKSTTTNDSTGRKKLD